MIMVLVVVVEVFVIVVVVRVFLVVVLVAMANVAVVTAVVTGLSSAPTDPPMPLLLFRRPGRHRCGASIRSMASDAGRPNVARTTGGIFRRCQVAKMHAT